MEGPLLPCVERGAQADCLGFELFKRKLLPSAQGSERAVGSEIVIIGK